MLSPAHFCWKERAAKICPNSGGRSGAQRDLVASFSASNNTFPHSTLNNLFNISKCICPNFKLYLSKLPNLFAQRYQSEGSSVFFLCLQLANCGTIPLKHIFSSSITKTKKQHEMIYYENPLSLFSTEQQAGCFYQGLALKSFKQSTVWTPYWSLALRRISFNASRCHGVCLAVAKLFFFLVTTCFDWI